MIDGVKVPFTAEEEVAKDVQEAEWADGATDRAFKQLRGERNRILHDTDWWASNDLIMTSEQSDYRQALRDLPATVTDPANPTWPTIPE
tara:strand:+ start:565 stop:831 length:267 start_codon:yes stop_codon:yes gene_type:complete